MSTPAPGSSSVLVVEDDLKAAQALRVLLEHYDYQVRHARTVSDARRMLDSDIDCVLLDLMLPDGDGADVLGLVRKNNLRAKVIVITGVSDAPRLRRVAELKPNAIKLKPVNFLDVLKVMQSAV